MIRSFKVYGDFLQEKETEQATTIAILDKEPSYTFKHNSRFLHIDTVIGSEIKTVKVDLGEPTGKMKSIVHDGVIARAYFIDENAAV